MKISKEIQKDIDIAVKILKKEGCSDIFLFGSHASGNANNDSDIDLAVKGITKGNFFKIYGQLIMALHHKVDLIDLNTNKAFAKHIFNSGNILRVA